MRITVSILFIAIFVLCVPADSSAQRITMELFKKRDRNRDGVLAKQELPKAARQRFDQIDKNRDGKISREEFQVVVDRMENNKPADTRGIKTERDLPYKAQDAKDFHERNRLDVYTSARKEKTLRPVLLFIHGGGLSSGDKAKLKGIGLRYVTDGFVVVCPNYRLAPDFKYPSFVNDVAEAAKWTKENVSKYGGDPKKIFVAGGSAGGYLATMVALDHEFLNKAKVETPLFAGLIAITPLLDVTTTGDRRLNATWGSDEKLIKEASPINLVRADSLPILNLYADGDTNVRKQMQLEFEKQTRKVGLKEYERVELKDRKHETIAPNMVKKDDQANVEIRDFIKRTLKADDSKQNR